jgi:hypothetical protein
MRELDGDMLMKTKFLIAGLAAIFLATGLLAQQLQPNSTVAQASPQDEAASTAKDVVPQDGQPGPQATAQPPSAPPANQPPAPPQRPPSAPAQAQQPPAPAAGQWVYTAQYGWVWMPYGEQYTYEPDSSNAYPYAYLYEPDIGWAWVVAPWIWGWGPMPYFGYWGPWHFHWYRGPGFVHGAVVGGAHVSGPVHPGGVHPNGGHPSIGFRGGMSRGGGHR